MIPDYTQHIAVLQVYLFLPASQSLKEKRMVLRSLKDRLRRRFNVSVSQLDGEDKWQTAVLGIAMIGPCRRYLDGRLNHVLSFIGNFGMCELCDHEILFL